MTKIEVWGLLDSIEFAKKFENKFKDLNYSVNYGTRIGDIKFNSFFDASEKYTYSNQKKEPNYNKWHENLINKDASEEDILITCLEIFVWGKVLEGNVEKAISLYKNNQLKKFVENISEFLKSNETINEKNIIWTSGWTKVYSFINKDIIIYDSRVSAFLNYSLSQLDNQRIVLNQFSRLLYNFSGDNGRLRKIDDQYGLKKGTPSGTKGLNANLIASWILQYLREKINLDKDLREYEKAFFMLGFDLSQINTNI